VIETVRESLRAAGDQALWQMLCPTAIVVLFVMDIVQPWMIIALSVVVGITDALSMPLVTRIRAARQK
jgi:hypothetical protein